MTLLKGINQERALNVPQNTVKTVMNTWRIFGSGTAKTGHHSKIYEETRRNVVIWQVVFMSLGYVVG